MQSQGEFGRVFPLFMWTWQLAETFFFFLMRSSFKGMFLHLIFSDNLKVNLNDQRFLKISLVASFKKKTLLQARCGLFWCLCIQLSGGTTIKPTFDLCIWVFCSWNALTRVLHYHKKHHKLLLFAENITFNSKTIKRLNAAETNTVLLNALRCEKYQLIIYRFL